MVFHINSPNLMCLYCESISNYIGVHFSGFNAGGEPHEEISVILCIVYALFNVNITLIVVHIISAISNEL